jgi:hypothetical protein
MEAYWPLCFKRACRSLERLDYSTWFDLWHTHLDWRSKGNRFPELRKSVAVITYRALVHAERLALTAKQPIQVFGTVCEDTGSNAVYLHTPNPNSTPYPFGFPNVVWAVPLPPELHGVVDLKAHEVGKLIHSDGVDYVIRKLAAGVA